MLVLVFILGGIVENQLQLWAFLAEGARGLLHLLALQISIVWALAFAVTGALLVLLASRIPRGQRTNAVPQRTRLANRVHKERSG